MSVFVLCSLHGTCCIVLYCLLFVCTVFTCNTASFFSPFDDILLTEYLPVYAEVSCVVLRRCWTTVGLQCGGCRRRTRRLPPFARGLKRQHVGPKCMKVGKYVQNWMQCWLSGQSIDQSINQKFGLSVTATATTRSIE